MKVSFQDLATLYREQHAEFGRIFHHVLSQDTYVLGESVHSFETAFASYTNALEAVGVGTGLDALALSLRAVGVGPGDAVIVPSNTYIATWMAVSHVGARLIPVEPDPSTRTIDVQEVRSQWVPECRAIMPVHLYGHPADLDPLIAFAADRNCFVIEDAAQAHGATYKGVPIGAHGHLTAWSFYPTKNLGAFGDGGAVTTNDLGLAARLRSLRNYGTVSKNKNDIIGYNTRLDSLQAALLLENLNTLGLRNNRRRDLARRYLDGIRNPLVTVPAAPCYGQHAWHQFVVQSSQRDELRQFLADSGIETMIHYPTPPHLQAAYGSLGYREGSFPIAERLAAESLSLPISPEHTDEEIEYVIDVLNSFPQA